MPPIIPEGFKKGKLPIAPGWTYGDWMGEEPTAAPSTNPVSESGSGNPSDPVEPTINPAFASMTHDQMNAFLTDNEIEEPDGWSDFKSDEKKVWLSENVEVE